MKNRWIAVLLTLLLLAVCIPALAAQAEGSDVFLKEAVISTTPQVNAAAVKKVTISGSHTVYTGKTTQLKAAVTPSSASQKVTWKSSNVKIAKISSSGKVTGVKPGSVTITAASKADPNKKASWKITVKAQASKVTVSGPKMVTVGKTITLKATVKPTTISQKVTWKSSNTKIATVSAKGVVKGVKAGTVTITATSSVTKTKKGTWKVTVSKAVESIDITGPAFVAMGYSVQLKAVVLPAGASKAVTWKSSKPGIATVSDTGMVYGVKAGKAVITVTSKADTSVKKTFNITVKAEPVSSITIEPEKPVLYLDSQNTAVLKAAASPSSAAQAFTWSSSDSKVVTVSEKGKVTGVKAGEATITATAVDGSGRTGSVTVKVLDFTPEEFAKDFEYYVDSSEENTCHIRKYIGSNTEIVIPKASPDGMTVIGIGSNVFKDNTTITSVTIQSTLKYIGEYAFQNCSGLTNVTIPEGLVTIRNAAFIGCVHLKSIHIPGTVNVMVSAFIGCTALTDVTLAEGVTEMRNAFQSCSSLKSVVIPSTVTDMSGAFSNCISLKEVTISDGVKEISDSAFSGCKSLKAVVIPGSAENVGSTAFNYCTTLSEVIIQEGVNRIEGSAFYECPSLRSVVLPETLVKIGGSAFYNCKSLDDLELPGNLVTIESRAFYGCAALQSVNIPGSVITISSDAFSNSGLKSVTAEEGLITLGGWAFQYCKDLTYVRLPESLVDIGSSVFSDCEKLTEIHCPVDSIAWQYAIDHNLTPVPSEGEEEEEGEEETPVPAEIAISATNFPDDHFREYVKTLESDETANILSAEEINNITKIDCSGKSISDLTGIGFFTELQELVCSNNLLQNLDLGKNVKLKLINCDSNQQLVSLNVKNCKELIRLSCIQTKLSKLDVSQNTALETLQCANNQLSELDISKNSELSTLQCGGNQLTSLNISSNTKLKTLSCGDNKLTALNIKNNQALEKIDVSNQLLNGGENSLTELDTSSLSKLTQLMCGNNKLTSLKLGNAVRSVSAQYNFLTSLDISGCKSLEALFCYHNEIKELNVKGTKFDGAESHVIIDGKDMAGFVYSTIAGFVLEFDVGTAIISQ